MLFLQVCGTYVHGDQDVSRNHLTGVFSFYATESQNLLRSHHTPGTHFQIITARIRSMTGR